MRNAMADRTGFTSTFNDSLLSHTIPQAKLIAAKHLETLNLITDRTNSEKDMHIAVFMLQLHSPQKITLDRNYSQ